MPNPLTDVVFELGDKSYRVVLGTWAQAVLEKRTGVSWVRFFARPVKDWGTSDFLELLFAGLSRYQGELSPEEVADIIDELGPKRTMSILSEAMTIAFPPPKGAKGKGSRPTKPPAKAPAA